MPDNVIVFDLLLIKALCRNDHLEWPFFLILIRHKHEQLTLPAAWKSAKAVICTVSHVSEFGAGLEALYPFYTELFCQRHSY